MENNLTKGLVCGKQALLLIVENTTLVGEVCNRHAVSPLLKTALGRTVSIASLLAGTLKDNQRISLKVKASNPGFKIFADADFAGNVRGYISDELLNATETGQKAGTLKELIGNKGAIQVVKGIGINQTFTGITDMPIGNITDDFSHYFRQSEQTSTWFSIHLDFNEKGEISLSKGVMAQLLPGAPVRLLHRIRSNLSANLWNVDPQACFEDFELLEVQPIHSRCGCSKEMLLPMLHTLGKDELAKTRTNHGVIELACNICGNKYEVQPEEIAKMLLLK